MEDRDGKIPIFKWSRVLKTVGPQPRPRHGHRAVAIRDLMVVFGGGNEGIHEDLHVFDTATGNWYIPPMNGDHSPGRAAFGFVVDNTRIITFGGMTEYGMYSNDLYELQASRWEWKYMRPRNTQYQPTPCARLGHSFNLIGNQVFMFGGLAQNVCQAQPKYLNDLFVLELWSDGSVIWKLPNIHGPSPPPRESHSAVVYEDKCGRTKLIVYGGMNGNRLGDLWTLHLNTMQWSKEIVCGKVPLPRSLHSATVMSHRMFVFGGWVPLLSDEKTNEGFFINEREWKCSNDLACLNLETMVWEELRIEAPEETLPRARAGHSAVAMNCRIYIWSGRDGYRKAWNNQICCKDLWFLEVEKPPAVGRVHLMSSSTDSLELNWPKLSYVDNYILQIQLYTITMTEKIYKLENSLVPPSSNDAPPSAPSRSVPVPHSCPKTLSYVPFPLSNSVYSKSPSSVPPSKLFLPKKSVILQQNQKSSLPVSHHSLAIQVTDSCTIPVQQSFSQNSSSGKHSNTMISQASAVVKPQQLNSFLSKPIPVVKLATVPDPIVITIPPQVPQQQSQVQSKPVFSSISCNSKIPVVSRSTIRKPICKTVSVTRLPIASHLPVACVPVPQFSPSIQPHLPLMTTSPHPTVPSLNVNKSATPSLELMPYLSSTLASLSNKLEASSQENQPQTASTRTELAVSVFDPAAQQVMATITQAAQVVFSQPSKINSKSVIIQRSELQNRFSNGNPVRIQKCRPLKNGPCVILQGNKISGPFPVAKENIPKLSTSQGGPQTAFNALKTTQGHTKQFVPLSGSGSKIAKFFISKPKSALSTSVLTPGARVIIKPLPVAMKGSKIALKVSSMMNSEGIRLQPVSSDSVQQPASSDSVQQPALTNGGVHRQLQSTGSPVIIRDSQSDVGVSDSSKTQPSGQCNVISLTVGDDINAASEQIAMVHNDSVSVEQKNDEGLKQDDVMDWS